MTNFVSLTKKITYSPQDYDLVNDTLKSLKAVESNNLNKTINSIYQAANNSGYLDRNELNKGLQTINAEIAPQLAELGKGGAAPAKFSSYKTARENLSNLLNNTNLFKSNEIESNYRG